METLLYILQVVGIILTMLGLLISTYLQLKLGRKEKRSFFTFLSVLSYPNDLLTDYDKVLKKIGGIALILGITLVILSGLDKLFEHLTDPPSVMIERIKERQVR